MKKTISIAAALLLAQLSFAQSDYTSKAKALMAKMTLEEKIGQLNLVTPGGGVLTGSVVSSDVESKIKNGQVGGLFGIETPEKYGGAN